ncbi:unnamed protein product [Schistocephalus solidus]|uniref:BZIP domain-containing protein n=1 Tax=Schistocephalus solidus TaxID=70667 RepID=A0A183S9H8_SCHSO|nr:unnamed protein product [Schistocephalus solidus]
MCVAPVDKLSELAVITSEDALSSTPHGPSTQRSSTSFSMSPSSQRQTHHQQNSFLTDVQMAAVAATLTPSPLINPVLQPLLSAPGLQEANQLSTAAAAAAAAQLLCQHKEDVGLSTASLPNSGLVFPLSGGGGGGQALAEFSRLDNNSLAQHQFGVLESGQGPPVTTNTSSSSPRSNQRRRGGANSRSPSRLMDERYRERRRRNNEAVRRCRENKRARINMRDEVTDKLQSENQSLRNELSGLSSEVHALRQLLSSTKTAVTATTNRVTSPTAAAAAAATEKADGKISGQGLTGSQVTTERESRASVSAATTIEALSNQTEELWNSPVSVSLETAKYAWPKKGLPRLHCRRRLTAPPYHEPLSNTEELPLPTSVSPAQVPPQTTAPTPPAALTEMMREAPILQH